MSLVSHPIFDIDDQVETDPAAAEADTRRTWMRIAAACQTGGGNIDYEKLITAHGGDAAMLAINRHTPSEILETIYDAVEWMVTHHGPQHAEKRGIVGAISANPNCTAKLAGRILRHSNEMVRYWGAISRNLSDADRRWIRSRPELLADYILNDTVDAEALWEAHRQDIDDTAVAMSTKCPPELLDSIAERVGDELKRRHQGGERWDAENGGTRSITDFEMRARVRVLAHNPNATPYSRLVSLLWREPQEADRLRWACREGGWDPETLRIAGDLVQEGWKGSLAELAAAVGAELPAAS